jgi:hypothetical protein
MVSEYLTKELLEDRIKFKLYAAEQHLIKLKEIEKEHNSMLKDRVNTEMEIDCFFAQTIGAKDSLLVLINDQLNLNIPIENVNMENINTGLKQIDKQYILDELNKLSSKPTSWLHILNDMRNHSLHRSMLLKHISVGFVENINTNSSHVLKPLVNFLTESSDGKKIPMDKTVVEYLEESLDRMKNLIKRIREKDVLLA